MKAEIPEHFDELNRIVMENRAKIKLSPNFTLGELTKSWIAESKGIENRPDPEQIENLKLVCEHILEPIRRKYNRPAAFEACCCRRRSRANRSASRAKTSVSRSTARERP